MQENVLMTVFTFLVSFIFSFAAVPAAKAIAEKIGAIDVPKDDRRMHKRPIARLGGLAIFFGFLVSILSFGEMTKELFGMLVGASIIVILGIFDDSKGLSAIFKLMVQIIAALVVVYIGDIRIEIFTNPNFLSEQPFVILPEWLSVSVTVLWIVAITNAVNLIDGLDGLAAGVSSIAAVSLVFIANLVEAPALGLIALAVAGACFGFLPFNFNPAKIIMGDTGATFLGFILSTLSIQGAFKSYAVISFAVPVLILGLPIFDTGFAILRRIFTGKGIMTADRGHIHHRLIDMGFSQKQTVFILYAISGVMGITAVVLAETGALRALVLLICVLIFIFASSYISSNPSLLKAKEDEEESIQITFEDIMPSEDKKGDHNG